MLRDGGYVFSLTEYYFFGIEDWRRLRTYQISDLIALPARTEPGPAETVFILVNKTYRTIWNEAIGAWAVASELASVRGGSGKQVVAKAVAMLLSTGLSANMAHAQYAAGGGVNTGSSPSQIAIGSGALLSAIATMGTNGSA